jgi:hypothetical protein
MTSGDLQSKLDELLRLPAETEWVEFKHNNENPEEIGEYPVECLQFRTSLNTTKNAPPLVEILSRADLRGVMKYVSGTKL